MAPCGTPSSSSRASQSTSSSRVAHAERDVVEARPTLVEGLDAAQLREAVQPEKGAAQLVDDVVERAGVLAEDGLDAEDPVVPGLAGLEVGDGDGHVLDRRHGGG